MPSASGSPSLKWRTLAGSIHTTSETPSIARFGHGYEAIWVAQTGSTYAIEARLLNAAGKPSGGVITTAVHGWTGMSGDPTILGNGGTRIIAFSGENGTYDGNAEYSMTSSNGKSWSLQSGSLSADDDVRADDGTAVTSRSGALVTVMARGDGVTFHVGASSSNPAPGTDPTSTNTTPFPGTPGVGTDATSNDVWAVWSCGDGGAGKDGVWAQQIYPSQGTLFHAPGSATANGQSAAGVQEDLSAAARSRGGLYTAYATPLDHSVVVWKLGAKKPVATLKDASGVGSVLVRSAPRGRIWVYWKDGGGWRATRSNTSASRFGPVTTVKTPKNTSADLPISGNGAAGPLEAVATVTTNSGHDEVLARQILPRLSIKASHHAVKRGHSFTVKVTDAGNPVKGATVTFGGHKKKTNKKGKARIAVKHGTSRGKHKVEVSRSGYTRASTKVRVT